MIVTMLTPRYHPDIGGVEKHVKKISERLSKKGHKVIILTSKSDLTTCSKEIVGSVEIYRIRKNIFLKYIDLIRYMNIIRKSDIIHCHDFSTFIFWYIPYLLIFPKKPVYITFHGYEGKIPIPRVTKLLRKITEKLTYGNICVGKYIQKWYDTTPNFITYGGVDYKKINTSPNHKKKHQAVFVGRLETDTGILTYIEALRILKEKYGSEIELHICGDGTLKDHISKTIAKYGINAILHGLIRNPETHYNKARYAFVSGYLAILEAMSSGCIVCSVYENNLKKDYLYSLSIPKSAMIIARSPDELADKLIECINNPKDVKKRSSLGQQYAKKQTWEKVVDKYILLWRSHHGKQKDIAYNNFEK
ncbi:glycosyltransferase family 4 protein [Geoglobus acetivorans]|uniref:Glycosyl transferase, group 1 n=1 Tax=Geoglobus acetivorans TaxID=565033 RepID=A0A0A7GE93_GEOAI|nr:glycosyl transferase, group 1 [Geoglobus acetivorans]